MDAREQLRRYLEQRRETGERELILDGMSVEDVMRIIGAPATPVATTAQPPERGENRPGERPQERAPTQAATRDERSDAAPVADWRDVLRATGSAPSRESTPARESSPASPPPAPSRPPVEEPDVRQAPVAPPPVPATPAPAAATPDLGDVPSGIVVGNVSRELFGGSLAHAATLDDLAEIIAKCTRCPLYKTATNPVPGQGSPTAELVCVGEAPGETEDKTGLPFVGAAGQLLTKILGAINLSREDVFICNVLKHRPPGNRNPMPLEVEACSPYLVRQLEIIRPKVIVAFGTFAAQTLLETKLSIGKLRGSVHRYYGIPLVVTYHPAALLRNPAWKRPTWEDVQLARRVLDRTPGA
jgi:uracil-DNA glycosylase family 4